MKGDVGPAFGTRDRRESWKGKGDGRWDEFIDKSNNQNPARNSGVWSKIGIVTTIWYHQSFLLGNRPPSWLQTENGIHRDISELNWPIWEVQSLNFDNMFVFCPYRSSDRLVSERSVKQTSTN